MPKKTIPKPTVAELEILQILWEKGSLTVREVNEKLNEKKEVGYTTTLKMLQIMSEKNLVKRDEKRRSHIYSAAYKQDDTQKLLLDKFLDAAFAGSASKLVMHLLNNKRTSKKEIEEIKEIIKKLESEE